MNLIERLEAATGPDRALDAEITAATGVINQSIDPSRVKNLRVSPDDLDWVDYEYEGDFYTDCARPFTSSIDAALTLVPEGAGLHMERYWIAKVEDDVWSASISTGGVPDDPHRTSEAYDARNAAIAICIAALKARGALLGRDGA